jgi:enoyl-CoA hydratase/carnithine racemase
MADSILVSRRDAIVIIALNRPAKLNALDRRMWQGIADAVSVAAADDSVRVVMLRGTGGEAFSAGADITEFPRERADVEQARAYGATMIDAMEAIGSCRHPTVALIEGACIGGGLELAAMCDLRICGASSRFGIPIKRLGLVMAYGELGGLVRLVGPAVALEILLEGRVFGADEALQKGLVTRVAPDADVEAEALAAARRIAEGAPLVARWHKRFVRRLADPAPLSDAELDEGFACFATDDYRIGYQAFLSKTTPAFKGR